MSFFDDGLRTSPSYEKSREQFPDDFVAALSADYGFDHADIDVLSDLYEIAERYRIVRSMEWAIEDQKKHRKKLIKLQRTYRRFLDELKENGWDYFNLEVSHGADLAGDLDPDLDPTNYPGKKFSKKGCYWFEFERYLKFFDLGLEATIERYKSRGGRPKNEGLDNAMHYIDDFWTDVIGKNFTLDYHNGTGTSEAFHFVKRLLERIEPVSDTQIVSAMRHYIKERGEFRRQQEEGFDWQEHDAKND